MPEQNYFILNFYLAGQVQFHKWLNDAHTDATMYSRIAISHSYININFPSWARRPLGILNYLERVLYIIFKLNYIYSILYLHIENTGRKCLKVINMRTIINKQWFTSLVAKWRSNIVRVILNCATFLNFYTICFKIYENFFGNWSSSFGKTIFDKWTLLYRRPLLG